MTISTSSTSLCETCRRPDPLCLCAYPHLGRAPLPIVVLQHPQEQDALLGTVPLLLHALSEIRLQVGLSWPSLARATGIPRAQARAWRVLYPKKPSDPYETSDVSEGEPDAPPSPRTIKQERPSGSGWIQGLIVLDGSWDQAKTLWWRNPWLSKIPRLTLTDVAPSIYGRLRKEPRPGYVSTLEAVARALEQVHSEGATLGPELRRQFRSLAQKTRDSGLITKTTGRKPARKSRSRPS